MEEPFESQFDPELIALVRHYEEMLHQKEHHFFDVFEYEDIIDYYIYINDLPAALKCLNKALRQHDQHPLILLKKAQYLIHTRKEHEAIVLLDELEHADLPDADFHVQKGNLFSQLERSEKAIHSYKKALETDENSDSTYVSIAFEYENLGKYKQAIKYLIEAIRINPENEAALFEVSFCFEISRQSKECIVFFKNFLDEHPYSN
jgi:tetratricopeptide (TPR) repeat protein